MLHPWTQIVLNAKNLYYTYIWKTGILHGSLCAYFSQVIGQKYFFGLGLWPSQHYYGHVEPVSQTAGQP